MEKKEKISIINFIKLKILGLYYFYFGRIIVSETTFAIFLVESL